MIKSLLHITTLSVPGLEPYRTLRRPLEHLQQGLFVAESEKVSRRLLESTVQPISALLSPEWFERYRETLERHPSSIDVFVGSSSLLETIVGHRLHQSMMVLAKVPRPVSVEEMLAKHRGRMLTVMLDGITNAENMGVIIRNCAGFHTDAVIVLPSSCDPYLRRSVRNSMGNIFGMTVVYATEPMREIVRLKEEGIRLYAAEPHAASGDIRDVSFSARSCIILGAEGSGISPEVLALADERVFIPMRSGVDSLNVASASAILLYEASHQLSLHHNGQP
jgi:tRNA G18 (ribose-2'-O)-methylase SpoU